MQYMRSSEVHVPNDCIYHPIEYRLHTKGEVAKSLGNQARGVQPVCTMTTQNSKISLISSIAKVDSLVINLLLANLIGQFKQVIVQETKSHFIEPVVRNASVPWSTSN